MPQNTSYAVMAQRKDSLDSLDDFPTPPWATRALLEHALGAGVSNLKGQVCLEPACGAGHMSKVLAEYFGDVQSYDVFDYGYGRQRDFLRNPLWTNSFDWMITNPPFKLAEEFVLRGLPIVREGLAVLTRTVFLESSGRYERLFRETPPTIVGQFVERVPIVKGRLDRKASTATGYCWLIWTKPLSNDTRVVWIPPCRKALERQGDYEVPPPTEPSKIPKVG